MGGADRCARPRNRTSPADRPHRPRERAHQRRFAGAVGAKHRHQLALGDVERRHRAPRSRRHNRRQARVPSATVLRRRRKCALAPARRSARLRRDRPCAPPVRPRPRAGAPSAILLPASSTTTWSETPITRSMSCSTRITAMPAVGELAQQLADRGAVLGVRTGRRLVERQHARAHGKCARDFDQALVDMRQRAGRPFERARLTDEGEQAFGDRGALRIALEPNSEAGAEPAAPQRDQRHCRAPTWSRTAGWSDRCGRCRRAQSDEARSVETTVAKRHRAGIGPVEAADHVERRAFAGAVGADDAGDRARLRVES